MGLIVAAVQPDYDQRLSTQLSDRLLVLRTDILFSHRVVLF